MATWADLTGRCDHVSEPSPASHFTTPAMCATMSPGTLC
jgi:hypothetical protein